MYSCYSSDLVAYGDGAAPDASIIEEMWAGLDFAEQTPVAPCSGPVCIDLDPVDSEYQALAFTSMPTPDMSDAELDNTEFN